eukprot:s2389_g2.t1
MGCYRRLPTMPATRHTDLGPLGAAVLIAKVNWGIGMIAMPFYLHAAGLEAGLLFFVLSMLLAWDAANVMHHLAQRLQETSYVALISKGLGPRSSVLATLAVLLAGWGSAVAWLKFIGDNVARFGGRGGAHGALADGRLDVAVLAVPLMACAWDITLLERFSFLGLVSGQSFVLLIFFLAAKHGAELPSYLQSQPFLRLESFPVAMGLAVFCNEGMVVMSSEVVCDFLWKEHETAKRGIVAQEVTLSSAFSVTPMHRVAVLCYVLQLLLTFPSSLFLIFRNTEQFFPSLAGASLCKRAWRVAFVLSCCGCAAVLPRFGDFLAVFGAVANSMCIYILPHLTLLSQGKMPDLDQGPLVDHLASHHPTDSISRTRQVWSWFVLTFFGGCCGLVAAAVSFCYLVDHIQGSRAKVAEMLDHTGQFPSSVSQTLTDLSFRCIRSNPAERPLFKTLVEELRDLYLGAALESLECMLGGATCLVIHGDPSFGSSR